MHGLYFQKCARGQAGDFIGRGEGRGDHHYAFHAFILAKIPAPQASVLTTKNLRREYVSLCEIKG
jgi:hypothetical protein